MKKKLRLLLLCSSLVCGSLMAQDLEQLKDIRKNAKEALKKGISVTGMAGANMVYYQAHGISGRNIPFNTLFTGNLSVDLFGKIKMPVTFSLSNQNINWTHPFDRQYRFMQPFNRLTLKPTYKGFTLHAGVASLTFSPYTLAGHRFDGVGLEYRPPNKPFYAAVMYGNLRRAVGIDPSRQTSNALPSYRRPGAGVQLGYKKADDRVELILFTARDVLTSLPYTLDSLGYMPEQNAVASLKGSKALGKKWVAEAEYALSGITLDTRATSLESTSILDRYAGLLKPRTTTEYKKALKGSVLYKGLKYNAGLEYSRIDPGYRTLGAYFFANDLESLSGKLASQLLNGKLTVAANLGMQRDNVQRQKLKTLSRWVGAANVAYVPNDKFSALVSYSNFISFSNVRPFYDYLTQVTPYQALDTLNFRQVNENIQGSVQYVLPSASENLTQNLGLTLMFQRGKDQHAGSLSDQPVSNNVSNYTLDYGLSLKPSKLNLALSAFYSSSDIAGIGAIQWGPSVNLQKTLGSEEGIQWKLRSQVTYSLGSMSGVRQNILNAGAGLGAGLTKKLNLNVNLIYLDRRSQSTERFIPSFREFTGTLGLVYNFSLL